MNRLDRWLRDSDLQVDKSLPRFDMKRLPTRAASRERALLNARVANRANPFGDDEQDRLKDLHVRLPLGIAEWNVVLKERGGGSVDLPSVDGMMTRAHGSVPD
jgi:hypothetical protein